MKASKYYRIAVNKGTIYAHYEPCGESLEFARKEFAKIKEKELEKGDTIEIQVTDFSTTKAGKTIWKKVK